MSVQAALQKRSNLRFQPDPRSIQWQDTLYSEEGTNPAGCLHDALPTRPLDQEKYSTPSGLIRTDILSSIHDAYSPPTDVLFQGHVQAPPQRIAVPPEIISELDAVQDDAVEEGFPVPSDELVGDVRRLLGRVYQIAPSLPYMIYPMEKGEIAIHVSNEPTGIVLLLCHETETWCVVSIGDSPCRAWFRDRERLPEAFVREALATLKSGVAW